MTRRYPHVFATLVTHFHWPTTPHPLIFEQMNRLAVCLTLILGTRDVHARDPLATVAWPGSELIIDEHEGHGGPAMVEAQPRELAPRRQMSRDPG